jgi:DNA-directed RNA polymerase specialized sigma24 family protein
MRLGRGESYTNGAPRDDPRSAPGDEETAVTTTVSARETGAPAPTRLTPVWDAGIAYDAYRDRLFASVVRSTRDAETANDIVADAFLELVRAGQRGDLPENELAWLHRVAANRVIDWSAVLRHEAHRELHEALDELPVVTRRALLLEGEGYQPAEIAQLIGRTGQATRTLLCRARRRLRERLVLQPV